ncbi:MgtC/SapB family protein [Clostridium sp. DMHC 10]|uniref:MgtC/SapB family protein n=1 Tax=Clostridium sp. DMHC 10 TaxID=747377 RepID=UPI00069D0D65|nr:MgtC/SapB family protein [Clostridium sp. DMHC 10]
MSDFFIRITLSGILSGIIGLERERRSKDAGLKTHFLVGIGSALMMIVSLYTFHDSRVAAQVVSGISFLGAGTIILEKHYVKGLTTAAGIWTTSGIGLAIGSGMYTLGIFSTTLVLAGLEILDRIFKNTSSKYLYINIWVKPEELINLSKK